MFPQISATYQNPVMNKLCIGQSCVHLYLYDQKTPTPPAATTTKRQAGPRSLSKSVSNKRPWRRCNARHSAAVRHCQETLRGWTSTVGNASHIPPLRSWENHRLKSARAARGYVDVPGRFFSLS